MIVKQIPDEDGNPCKFESSVNSYDSQTHHDRNDFLVRFESSVNSYDSQT